MAEFREGPETWQVPVVGWAVVVEWTDYKGGAEAEFGAALVPVVLDDGMPMTTNRYEDRRRDSDRSLQAAFWGVKPANRG